MTDSASRGQGRQWGVCVPLPALTLRAHGPFVARLPELGFTDVWTAEGGGLDAVTPLAASSAWAPSLRLGTGIMPVFTRGPAVIAQTAAALAELAPGRVVLGIGSSVPAHVTDINGIPHTKPLSRVRDTVRFLKRVLRGQRVDGDFDTFSLNGFELPAPPAVPPRVIVGALRPKMLELAFTEADGAITNVLSADDLDRVLSSVPVPLTGKEVAVKIFVCPTADAAFARAQGRRFLSWILNRSVYRAFHEWLGRDELAPMHRRWDAGDVVGAQAGLPDQVVDELWVHGTFEQCRRRIAEYMHPSVTTIVLYLATTPELLDNRISVADILEELSPARIEALRHVGVTPSA